MMTSALMIAASQFMALDCTNTASDNPDLTGRLFISFALENGRVYNPDVVNVVGGLDASRSKFRWKGIQIGEETRLSAIYREKGMVETVELSLKKRGGRDYDLTWERSTAFVGSTEATIFVYAGQGTCLARDPQAGSPQ